MPEKRPIYKMAKLRRLFAKLRHHLSAKSPASGAALPATVINTNQNQINPATTGASVLSTASMTQESGRDDYHSANAPLENLPPEVRRHLLFFMDFESLRTLVHASPVYHEQYLLDRRLFLCDLLAPELHMITSDACAVDQSGTHDFSRLRARKKYVIDFLRNYGKNYQSQDLTQHSLFVDRSLSLSLLGRLASFHFSVVQPLARCYHEWTLANFAKEADVPTSRQSLSKTEKMRLMRALYRFQLCCNLFGRGRHDIPQEIKLEMDEIDILKHFICIFEPWEVEEICCIYTFSKLQYEKIFNDISWDVNEMNPKFDGQRPPTPVGAFHLDNGSDRYYLLKGMISCGLELLRHVLLDMKDHEHLVSTMQKHMYWFPSDFLEYEALGDLTQAVRRREAPTERDRKQRRRDPLPFRGDVESDSEGAHPPLAWTIMWGGTYSNLYGYYVGDDIRSWGYVMWDAPRFEQMGAEAVLRRQRAGHFGGRDPREDNYLM